MKLSEIRDKYVSTEVSYKAAKDLLFDAGIDNIAAQELLDLWYNDLQHQAAVDKIDELRYRPGLDLAASLELIDDAYIRGQIDKYDALELWHETGLPADQVEAHADTIGLCRRSHELCWKRNAEAPDWIRQLSSLAKLFMQGEINSYAALKQLDPKDEYPHVAGAILAHLIERRDSTAELAAAARKDPTILDDGIEYCRICGRARAASQLSRRGLCKDCQFAIQSSAVADLMNHSGPYYRRWREAMLQAMYDLEDEMIEERTTDPEEPERRELKDYLPEDEDPDEDPYLDDADPDWEPDSFPKFATK